MKVSARVLFGFCAAVVCFLPCLVFSQQEKPESNILELEKKIVSATRHESSLKKTPSISHVVTRDDIEKINALKTSDVLQYVSGVNIESGTGSGGPYKKNISVSGMPNYYNVVMVNGMRIRSSHIQTGVNIDLIPVASIERIEIIKDASSALYGSDALGGVINIITRKGTAKQKTMLGGGTGTYSSYNGEVMSRGSSKSGKTAYSVYAGYQRSDGADILAPKHRIGHLDYRKTSGLARLDFYPIEDMTVSGYLNFLTDDAEFSDAKLTTRDTTLVAPDSSTSTWYQVENEYEMKTALMFMPGLNASYMINDMITAHLQAYYTHWDAEISTELDELASPRLSFDFRLPGNLVTVGTEYLWRNYFRGGMPDTADQYTVSGFVQDQLTLLDSSLIALIALRTDYVANTGNDAVNNGPVFSPKLSVLYRPVNLLALRLSAGRGFKAPTVQELYEHRYHFGSYRLGNAELGPEYSTNIAASCRLEPHRFWYTELSGYFNMLDDMIVVVPIEEQIDNKVTYKRFNMEEGFIYGGELHGGLRLGNKHLSGTWDGGIALSYQSSEDDSLNTLYHPGINFSSSLTIRSQIMHDRYATAFIGYNGATGREYWKTTETGININTIENLHNLNVGLSFELLEKAEVFGKLSNILMREHESYEDVLMKIEGDMVWEAGVRIKI
ncbi:MAG: TonB-dependent receptor [Fibrobacteria bacterium]|nr:TonB-dependent receptor [Fibrobacteria bacterium]